MKKDVLEKNLILDDTDRAMSVREVAIRLGVSPDFVRDLITVKMLSAMRFKRNIKKIRKFAFNEFMAKYDNEDIPAILEEKLNLLKEVR